MIVLLMVGDVNAMDYANPVIDVSDRRRFPVVMVVPSGYEWPGIINDDINYREPVVVRYNRPGCKTRKLDIMGWCIEPVLVKKVVKPVVKKVVKPVGSAVVKPVGKPGVSAVVKVVVKAVGSAVVKKRGV